MKWFGSQSLRGRVFGGILFTTASALLIAGSLMVTYNLANYRDNIIRDTTGSAALVGFASIPALQFNDPELARKTLGLLQTQPDIVAAALYQRSGNIFARYLQDDVSVQLPRLPGASGYEIEGDYMDVNYRVIANDEILGTVYVKTRYRRAELFRDQAILVISVTLVALVISMLLSYWMQMRLTGPVLEIAKLAQRITHENDYTLRAKRTTNDEIGVLTDSFNALVDEVEHRKNEMRASHDMLQREVADRENAEREIQRLNEQLEARVVERTRELENANSELEAFSYSVSHDLRGPLRAIDGFSQALLEDCSEQLDGTGTDYLRRVRAAAQRMGQLIDDLLKLSRITRAEFNVSRIDLTQMAAETLDNLKSRNPERNATTHVTSGLMDYGDAQLLRIALENLLGNAWKYTGRNEYTEIEFGMRNNNGKVSYFVQDNGAGFDMAYAGKLFGAFQRLHETTEFSGTGIGLATVQRIIHRHDGEIWAEAETNKGATFYFTLNARRSDHET
ncbi:MAG: HAMP domain-containing protein [Proteobacteria bacterium]|nr:HAMP domain-containing protein [Pseudomonadota bacterium]